MGSAAQPTLTKARYSLELGTHALAPSHTPPGGDPLQPLLDCKNP